MDYAPAFQMGHPKAFELANALVQIAPELASATVALNTSAMYGGQALGAALGGVMIAQGQMLRLHEVGLVVMLAAMALSWQAARVQRRSPAIAAAPHTA